MPTIVIREWGKLIASDSPETHINTSDKSYLPRPVWQALADLITSNEKSLYLKFSTPHTIQVCNYVGVIMAGNWQIEILPKTTEKNLSPKELSKTRNLLWKMLSIQLNLPIIKAQESTIRIQDNMPLLEKLIKRFLAQVVQLVRCGIRKDYERIESEERFLKGQLQVVKQIRQPPDRRHFFQIEYDIFSENRAENRLIHSALVRVSRWAQQRENQRLANELRVAFDHIPESRHIKQDLSHWRTSRDMHTYQPLLPWLKLILNQQNPFALKDSQQGISFLFPMEKLFEGFVAYQLRQRLDKAFKLKEQVQGNYLASTIKDQKVFMLKPDLIIYKGKQIECVLDTKWKLIDAHKNDDTSQKRDLKNGISQSDIYQLFAYGHRFLNGRGAMGLIYPVWSGFHQDKIIEPYEFYASQASQNLKLYIIPFCLEKGFDRLPLALTKFFNEKF